MGVEFVYLKDAFDLTDEQLGGLYRYSDTPGLLVESILRAKMYPDDIFKYGRLDMVFEDMISAIYRTNKTYIDNCYLRAGRIIVYTKYTPDEFRKEFVK